MVKWTAHAKPQLRRLHDYIAEDSPIYAKRVSEALVQKTIALDELPRKGKKVSELNVDAVRELSLYSYRILYEIKPVNPPFVTILCNFWHVYVFLWGTFYTFGTFWHLKKLKKSSLLFGTF